MKEVDAIIERLSRDFWLQKETERMEKELQQRRAEHKIERDESRQRVAVKGVVISQPLTDNEIVVFDFQQDTGRFIHVVISGLLANKDLTEFMPGSRLKLYGYYDRSGARLLRVRQMAVYKGYNPVRIIHSSLNSGKLC